MSWSVTRKVSVPGSEDVLLERARALAGQRVGEIAAALGCRALPRGGFKKGAVGELVELALGASAKNLDLPDFPHLGLELKTIPLDRLGRVRQSTFVCSLDLASAEREIWASCRVWRKLSRVLWIPVEPAGRGVRLEERHLGTPLLWNPSAAQEALLREDWTELMGRVAVGDVETITGHLGRALQIRPKARNGASRVFARGPEGEPLQVMPRGFYLRAWFTEAILWGEGDALRSRPQRGGARR